MVEGETEASWFVTMKQGPTNIRRLRKIRMHVTLIGLPAIRDVLFETKKCVNSYQIPFPCGGTRLVQSDLNFCRVH